MANRKTDSNNSSNWENCFVCMDLVLKSNSSRSHFNSVAFLNSWARFVNIKSLLESDEDPNICADCLPICASFSELYQLWNFLQLKLEWNLKKIVEISRVANKATSVKEKEIPKLRKLLIEKSKENLIRSTPRVIIHSVKQGKKNQKNLNDHDDVSLSPAVKRELEEVSQDSEDDFPDPVEFEDPISEQDPDVDMELDEIHDDLCSDQDNDNEHDTHEPKKRYSLARVKCQVCQVTVTEHNMKQHMKYHQTDGLPPDRIFKCDHCSVEFSKQGALKHHVKLVHSQFSTNACIHCQRTFTNAQNLRRHIKVKHPNADPHQFTCNILQCTKSFTLETQLQKHQETCEMEQINIFQCTQCGKLCKDKNLLNGHMRTAHQEKSIICNECGKLFRLNFMLKRHMQNCHQEKTLECPKCGKMFGSKSALREHLKTVCADNSSYLCTACGECFTTRKALNRHTAFKHQSKDEWRFECQECGKKFPGKANLSKHMKTHPTRKNEEEWKQEMDESFMQSFQD